MPNLFFTSDTHFYDESQILFGSRPFDTVEAMNETMIARWNARVKKDDLVYHLGDFALECSKEQANGLVDRLNGRIALIRGNNDSVAKKIKDRFVLFKDYEELLVDDEDGLYGGKHKVILLHYAMRVWRGSHNGSWHLYGHSHGSLPDDPYSFSFDVGVDCWDFTPISYQQVKETMARKLVSAEQG